MKLEDQVCSLELAKRLKELGVKQESYFYWEIDSRKGAKNVVVGHWDKSDVFDYCSAFTVAELMDRLPAGFFLRKHGDEWAVIGLGVPWTKRNGDSEDPLEEIALQIADAPAEMLIYLIEQKLVKP